MIKDLITWVLNNYIGKYIENFDSSNVSFGLLSGKRKFCFIEKNTCGNHYNETFFSCKILKSFVLQP